MPLKLWSLNIAYYTYISLSCLLQSGWLLWVDLGLSAELEVHRNWELTWGFVATGQEGFKYQGQGK